MTFWLATTNLHKIYEIKAFFKKDDYVFYDVSCLKNYISPEETGATFKENAKIKAQTLAAFFRASQNKAEDDVLILGEDSGLEVLSLDYAPGIYSARYSGAQGNDIQNNQLLLKNMKGQKNRSARYVCAICCILKDQKYFFEGVLEGQIALNENGQNGFGYDPLFVPEGETKTLGQLPWSFKGSLSHRFRALKQMQKHLL